MTAVTASGIGRRNLRMAIDSQATSVFPHVSFHSRRSQCQPQERAVGTDFSSTGPGNCTVRPIGCTFMIAGGWTGSDPVSRSDWIPEVIRKIPGVLFLLRLYRNTALQN